METDPLFVEVAKFIAEELSVPQEKVTPEASFINDLGADSLDLVELQMSLEEKYKMSIPEDVGNKFTKVQDVIDFIKKINPSAKS